MPVLSRSLVSRSMPEASDSSAAAISSTGAGAATGVATDLVERFLAAFFVPFLVAFPGDFFADFFVVFAAFFAVLRAPPFLAAFFVVFFADFFAAFFELFAAPPRDWALRAVFFVALPPPLRAPLDFFDPFLAAISFAPSVGLGLALTVAK